MPALRPRTPTGETIPQWRREIAQEIGEDPGRFLDADILMNEAARELFEGRLRGIRSKAVVARWLEVEHRLDRKDCPRSSVVEKLEQHGRWLDEAGERDIDADPGPDLPIHTGGDPEDPPPKTPNRPGTTRFDRGAARHYHYITLAKPFLEARDQDDQDGGGRDDVVDDGQEPAVATDGGADGRGRR